MKEYHIYGSPGCGKTTRLATQSIPEAVKRYGSDKVVVVSFTRAAAREIANRQDSVNPEHVGTLHALCYRGLKSPVIAETKVKEWNAQFPAYAVKAIKNGLHAGGGVEFTASNSEGDRLLQEYNLNRNKLIPKQQWSPTLRSFAEKWESWKQEKGYFDFTDLIERALYDRPYPPNNARVLIVDEAQDLTPLQLKLIRSWGQHCDYLVLAGDDDQTIYSFSGASPDVFLKANVDESNKIILNQSYRLPRKVYDVAMRHVQQISHRQPKEYNPTDTEGFFSVSAANYKTPDLAVFEAIEHVKQGKTVMFLVSCRYMLNRTIVVLKQQGVPFHNPYRHEEYSWNPLRVGKEVSTTSDIVRNFLDTGIDKPYWNAAQFLKWVTSLKDEVLTDAGRKGLKLVQKAIDEQIAGLYTVREVLHQILIPDAIEHALNRDIEWLKNNVKNKHRNALGYPLKVYEKYGMDGLSIGPKDNCWNNTQC